MNKRRIIGGAALVTLVVIAGSACRQGDPTGEPKMPANRPIPEIERKEEDPKASPSPRVGDAG